MAAGHFLLLAQKKVTKENGTLGSAPSLREGSLRANGFGQEAIHGLSAKSARSLAPPACGARGFSVRPSPLLRGNPGAKAQWIPAFAGMTVNGVPDICGASAAGTAALCSSRAPLGRGEQAKEKVARSAIAGRMPATLLLYMDVLSAKPVACSRSRRAWMPGDRGRGGCPFLWLLSFGQAKESDRRPGMVDETHTDVSRFSRRRPKASKIKMDPGFRRDDGEEPDAGFRADDG